MIDSVESAYVNASTAVDDHKRLQEDTAKQNEELLAQVSGATLKS